MKCTAVDRSAKKIKEIIYNETAEFLSVILTYTLVDKYGFGKEKVHQILTTFNRLAEELKAEDIKFQEIKDMLYEEYDIKFI